MLISVCSGGGFDETFSLPLNIPILVYAFFVTNSLNGQFSRMEYVK